MKENVEIHFTWGKFFLDNSCSICHPSLYDSKDPEAHFSRYVVVNQLVKRSKEMSVVALEQSGQINYGAGFDRLISSPK